MKKIVALILAAVLLCCAVSALADGIPHKDTFAAMKTKTKGNFTYITLSQPVDKLYANWLGELQVVELAVNDELKATVLLTGHEYQLGVAWTDEYEREIDLDSFNWIPAGSSVDENDEAIADAASYVNRYTPCLEAVRSAIDKDGWAYAWRMNFLSGKATAYDRAYITLQGDWIVCYSRKGEIVDIIAAKTKDIDDIRNAAFK